MTHDDDACAVAHGTVSEAPGVTGPVLVAVFASPVAGYLLRYGRDLGFTCLVVEPDAARASGAATAGLSVLPQIPDGLGDADIVVTDHHRDELGPMLRDALDSRARWIGVMGNPRHPAPHIPALRSLGVDEDQIANIHRPIGLNIGSRTPAEIALATLAGLVADRNGRPGGFEF